MKRIYRKRLRAVKLNSDTLQSGCNSCMQRGSSKFSNLWKKLFLFVLLASVFATIASNIAATLDSNDGSSAFVFRDSDSAIAASIDSDGNVQAIGGLRLDAGGEECENPETLIVDGKIGVGTTSPVATLHVRDLTAGADVDARIEDGTDAVLQFSDGVDDARYLGMQNDGDVYLGSTTGTDFMLKADGKCGIGNNSPLTNLDVNGDFRYGVSGALMKLGIYRYSTVANVANQYIHLKTNQGMDSKMATIRFYGYQYSPGVSIDAQISYYPYGPTTSIINVGATGTHTLGVYKGAGNLVILTIYVSSTYYVGFYIDALFPNPTGMDDDFAITAATYNAAATGVY